MAEAKETIGDASTIPKKPLKPPNPIWRMMGLPNFRLRLPSRNWTIFLTITGSWTAAVMYDRRQKRLIQRKWAKLVEHIASETIHEHQLNRRLTVYISAPPADGLVTARDHFNEYVKPILVAAALDWDAVEGRREGDVRAGLAERIRRLRKLHGESSVEPLEEDLDIVLTEMRKRSGVTNWDGVPGDIVIGRHTWKEYVRGLHEGWLGPLDLVPASSENSSDPAQTVPFTNDAPSLSIREQSTVDPKVIAQAGDSPSPVATSVDDRLLTTAPVEDDQEKSKKDEAEAKPREDEKPKRKQQPPPFNSTADYSAATLSPNCPNALGPTAVVPLPHLLGFFNFPVRMYRFLNRRKIADDVGRETAAAVIAVFRPFETTSQSLSGLDEDAMAQAEQQYLLAHEEPDWHKNVRERKDDAGNERVWLDDMVLDSRIAGRMRRFELDSESEEKASRIAEEREEPWWQRLWPKKDSGKKMWEGLDDAD